MARRAILSSSREVTPSYQVEHRGSTQPREDLPIKPLIVSTLPESQRIKHGETLELEVKVESIPAAQFQVCRLTFLV